MSGVLGGAGTFAGGQTNGHGKWNCDRDREGPRRSFATLNFGVELVSIRWRAAGGPGSACMSTPGTVHDRCACHGKEGGGRHVPSLWDPRSISF